MSDVTMIRGYAFPRGSKMDFAGYGAAPQAQNSYLFNVSPQLEGYHGYGDTVLPDLNATDPNNIYFEQPSPIPTAAKVALGAAAFWFLFLRG